MKQKLIETLELLKQEVDKRNEIYKHGVDLSNYENICWKAVVDLVAYSLSLMNKKVNYTEEELKEEVEWWLWERSKKEVTIVKTKKVYNLESAKDFVNFLLKH